MKTIRIYIEFADVETNDVDTYIKQTLENAKEFEWQYDIVDESGTIAFD